MDEENLYAFRSLVAMYTEWGKGHKKRISRNHKQRINCKSRNESFQERNKFKNS